MNDFYYLFMKIGVALGTVIWLWLVVTIVSILRIKSRNLTDEFNEFKKQHKGPFVHFRFLCGSKKMFIAIWSLVVVGSMVASFAAFGNQKYYDMCGNAYKDQFQVVFYTESGEEYVALEEEYAFVQVDNPENIINGLNCFLDQNGYLVFISTEDIGYDENASDYEPYCYYDTDNNRYAKTLGAYWNEKGELFFTSRDREKMDELVKKLNDFLKEPNYE